MSIIENKYSKIYYSLIKKAQTENRSKKNGYYESHHIIPKSLGGSNQKVNLVLLSAREHFIAHLLLVRCVEKKSVYKMTSALARFKKQAINGKSYELFRRTLSKFNKGEFNKSFGKVWIHHIDTKEIKYIDKNNIDNMDDKWVKGLPFQKGGYTSDYIWFNKNGIRTAVHKDKKDQYLENGWKLGRDVSFSSDHFQKMSKARHTYEKDLEHSKKLTGRVALRLPNESKVIRVFENQVDEYLNKGFILHRNSGMKMITSAGRKCSIDGVIYNSVTEASKILNEGYQKIIRKIKNERYTQYFYV